MDFKDITNDSILASFLEMTESNLKFFLEKDLKSYTNTSEIDPSKKEEYVYRRILINKRHGGQREVFEVNNDKIKSAQRIIRKSLSERYDIPSCVHGFIKGMSPRTNAEQHLAKKYIIKVDIKDFFISINKERVIKVFISMGCSEDIALKLSKFTTYKNHLAQGFFTSPIISNIVFSDIDNILTNHASDNSLDYTRYGDDLTFSSNNKINIKEIENIIERNGFKLNTAKTRNMHRGMTQTVTGLTVFDASHPRIPKKMKKILRLHMYYIEKYGMYNHFSKNNAGINPNKTISELKEILGWVCYINSIEPSLYKKYIPILEHEIEKEKQIMQSNYTV
jgi:retron-type reverse transcriptase